MSTAAPGAVSQGLDAPGLAEIDAAGELPQDQDVETLDQLRLQRAGLGQCREDHGRAEIGEELQLLAQAQQALLRLQVERVGVVLGAAHGAEDDGVRGLGERHRAIGHRHAVRVEGSAADEIALALELQALAVAEPGDDALDLGHHLGADAVTGQEQKIADLIHGGSAVSKRVGKRGETRQSVQAAVPR